jgi:hypothetical protein
MKKAKLVLPKSLTRSQIERLALLSEALGQAQEVVGRVLRLGYNLHGGMLPATEGSFAGPTFPIGRVSLQDALGSVLHAIDRMTFSGDVSHQAIAVQSEWRARHVEANLSHQGKTGFKTWFSDYEKQKITV